MLVSLRIKPEVAPLLKQACRAGRKTRTAVIHEALEAYLRRGETPLGEAIRQALAVAPKGMGLRRRQPRRAERRRWDG